MDRVAGSGVLQEVTSTCRTADAARDFLLNATNDRSGRLRLLVIYTQPENRNLDRNGAAIFVVVIIIIITMSIYLFTKSAQ